MAKRYILSEYVEQVMDEALYDKLEDGTFAGRIPSCKGVLAFEPTLLKCEDEPRSTLEDWILVGVKTWPSFTFLPALPFHNIVVRKVFAQIMPSLFQ